ncbi:hypothetical protein BGZ73_003405 [Actinomortierella ambigua]|nr:hypothetical protein BGZ73_003405 [Actinomortierella ambigua]
MSSTHYTSLPESPESPATSKPIKWPLLRNAIPAWRSYQRQVFIVGNPVVWGLCAIGLAAFWAIRSLITLRDQRGYTDGPTLAVLRSTHLKWSTYMAAGWAIHYMPFFFLKRGLFLYHYYPAFYCSILLTASMFSSLCTLFIRPIRVWLLAACMALTWVSFWYMSPLSYGSILRRESCTQMTSWHILRPEWGGGGSGHGGGFSSGINCDLTPTKDTLVQPISIAAQQARQDKLLWQERTEEYRIRSRALLDASQMPRSIAGQVRALFREPRLLPPGVGVGKDAAAGTSSHRLPQNYPPEDTVLPREDVFLAPYQRPPQWRSSPQNVYDGQTGQSQRNRYNPELNYVQHQKQRLDAEQAKAALERQAQGQKKVEVKKPIQTQPPKQQPRQPHVQQQQQRVQQQEKPKGQENQAQVKKQDGVHQRPAQEKPAVAPVEQGKERPRQPQQ